MKARVKATGKIVEVIQSGSYINEFGTLVGEYKTADGIMYSSYELDFYIDDNIIIPDYWTRLEHQAAIGAMQGILSRQYLDFDKITEKSVEYAHALVEELKEKEERK